MKRILALLTPALLSAELATAQVVVSEVCPEPTTDGEAAEWIELDNLGEARVNLAGYTLSDHLDTGEESPVRWAFTGRALIAPDTVVLVARQARAFRAAYGRAPDYELADGDDDASVPNLVASNGVDALRLSSRRSGDAVVLRDARAALADAFEWGTLDRDVPGIPLTTTAVAGESFVRVRRTGSSQADFVVTDQPSPGVGFVPPLGPVLSEPRVTPIHLEYPAEFSIEATVTDADGLAAVEIALATATSSRGEASTLYVPLSMMPAERDTYGFRGDVSSLLPSLMFAEPATFHDRYLRFFLYAEDDFGNSSTAPSGATEWSTNGAYYSRNVVPSQAAAIADVRVTDAEGRAAWIDHSARVRGVVIAPLGSISDDGLELAVADAEGWGVRVRAQAVASALGEVVYAPGDLVEVLGDIRQESGVTWLGRAAFVKTGAAHVPTSTVTVATLLADPERYESRLVTIVDARVSTEVAAWGDEDVAIADATGELPVRVFAGNALVDQATPEGAFHLRGVVGQRAETTDGLTGGYYLTPRGPEDLKQAPPPSDDPAVDLDGDGVPDPASEGTGATAPGATVPDEGCTCNETEPRRADLGTAAAWLGLGLLAAFARSGRSRS